MKDLAADLRYAVRTLASNPEFTCGRCRSPPSRIAQTPGVAFITHSSSFLVVQA